MKTIFFALLVSICFISCKKSDIANDTPACIVPHINTPLKPFKDCANASVNAYNFQGKTIYIADLGNCVADGTATVFTETCDVLGYIGGIANIRIVNGENISNAVFIRKIWSR